MRAFQHFKKVKCYFITLSTKVYSNIVHGGRDKFMLSNVFLYIDTEMLEMLCMLSSDLCHIS